MNDYSNLTSADYKRFLAELINQPNIICSYEEPYTTHFIVFEPYTDKYEQSTDYYQSLRFIDDVRKFTNKFNEIIFYVITREIIATKIHVNLIITSRSNTLTKEFGSYNIHFGYKITKAGNTWEDRKAILFYMFKELKERQFKRFLDYSIKLPLLPATDVPHEAMKTTYIAKALNYNIFLT